MNILYIFFVCSIIIELCFADGTISEEKRDSYLRQVHDEVWEKTRAYGLSNLPDVDMEMRYDIPVTKRRGVPRNLISIKFDSRSIADGMGHDINGTLYWEDGFVIDIADITLIHKGKTTIGVGNKTATIQTLIKFEGMSFLRDFRFEADDADNIPDQALGCVIIKPEEFYFDIKIRHDLINDAVNCTMSNSFQGRASKASLDFYPKNALTDRLKKGLSYAKPLFGEIGGPWQRVYEPILNEVVETIPFPAVDFPVDRH